MVFKSNWEKTQSTANLSQENLNKIIASLYGKQVTCELISGGCANLNYKVKIPGAGLEVLRIYIRDSKSAKKENKISELLSNIVPVPKFIAINNINGYTVARLEYIDGITLRDMILKGNDIPLFPIMYEAGNYLTKIQEIHFPKPGFFDENLEIIEVINNDLLSKYIEALLCSNNVIQYMSSEIYKWIKDSRENIVLALSSLPEASLVHGDYDPANILVCEEGGSWHISAILDWEFAHSGSHLIDVANMLRYADKVSTEYKEGFLQALKDYGPVLSNDWELIINYSNILSLLDLLAKTDPINQPNRLQDIQQRFTALYNIFG